MVSSKRIFHDFQERMIHWMDQNYSRILDLFRRFDSDNSGTISYDEFAAGMKDLGELVITTFFLAFFFFLKVITNQ